MEAILKCHEATNWWLVLIAWILLDNRDHLLNLWPPRWQYNLETIFGLQHEMSNSLGHIPRRELWTHVWTITSLSLYTQHHYELQLLKASWIVGNCYQRLALQYSQIALCNKLWYVVEVCWRSNLANVTRNPHCARVSSWVHGWVLQKHGTPRGVWDFLFWQKLVLLDHVFTFLVTETVSACPTTTHKKKMQRLNFFLDMRILMVWFSNVVDVASSFKFC